MARNARATSNGGKNKTMKIKAVIIALMLMIGAGGAIAQTTTTTTRTTTWDWNERFSYDSEGDRFRANEFSVDLFGSYLRGEAEDWDDVFDDTDGGRWGGGLGLNYFITRWFGVGADAAVHSNGGAFVDYANANLIFRVPIDAISLAPYAFGGGGYLFDPDEVFTLHAGLGLEFRLNANTGIFIDGRYTWGEDSFESSQIRSGLRFAF